MFIFLFLMFTVSTIIYDFLGIYMERSILPER